MRTVVVVLSLVLFTCAAGGAQEPSVPTACEQQVQEQYRQLSADGLVVQGTAPQWGPQLIAMATQIRTSKHLTDIKRNQAELAEQNVVTLLEQLRLAQQAVARLKGEPERGAPAN